MQVGDKVWIKPDRGELRESNISKIGSKYIYADRTKFYKDTLREVSVYGCPDIIYLSKEVYDQEIEFSKLRREIASAFDWYYGAKLTLDQLRRIKAILEEKQL